MTNFKALKKISKDFTLLFVEDDFTLRNQTAKIFSNLFRLVDTAENGKEGLESFNNYFNITGKYYDIVVSDIEMPYINGIELSRRILAINNNQKIVIMSAYDDKEYLLDLIKIGIECFMQKPLSTDHLLDTMHKVCVSFEDETSTSFGNGYYFNNYLKILFHNTSRINISYNETMLLELLLSDKTKKFTANEIHHHIYDDIQETFVKETVDSLIQRLSNRLPDGSIINDSNIAFGLNLSTR
ncbi:MAG: response regulator [Fluviicola sp.]|nr:response regulator [Fluviicola sp.]